MKKTLILLWLCSMGGGWQAKAAAEQPAPRAAQGQSAIENQTEVDLASILLTAARQGDLAQVQAILEKRPRLERKPSFRQTLLDAAAESGHLPLVQYLSSRTNRALRDLEASALKAAAGEGHLEVVQFLLQQPAAHALSPLYLQEALHSASQKGRLEVVQALCAMLAADRLRSDKLTQAALLAAKAGQTEIVEYLLQAGAHPQAVNEFGENLLMLAAESGQSDLILDLLQRGLKLSDKTGLGETALSAAAASGKQAIFQLLLEKGAPLDRQDRRIVHNAVARNQLALLQYLQTLGMDLFLPDEQGTTALHTAAQYGHVEIFQYLLAQTNAPLQSPQQALKLFESAIQGEQLAIIQSALKMLPEIDQNVDFKKHSVLGLALEYGPREILPEILKRQPDLHSRNALNETPLMLLAKKGSREDLEHFVALGADMHARDETGASVLMHFAQKGHLEAVQWLIGKGADAKARDLKGKNLLMYAAESQNLALLHYLLELGLDPKQKTVQEETLLMHAMGGDLAWIQAVSQFDPDLEAQDDAGNTLLHRAVTERNPEAVQWLLGRGVYPNRVNKKGQNALMLAAQAGNADLLEVLLAQKPDLSQQDQEGKTALHLAFESFDQPRLCSALLLQAQSPTDRVDIYQRSPLFYAILKKHRHLLPALVNRNTPFNELDYENKTVLMRAAELADLESMQHLLAAGADPNFENENGNNALLEAVRAKSLAAVDLLLQQGARVQSQHEYGTHPLALALQQGDLPMVQHLLKAGASLRDPAFTTRSALLYAAESGQMEVLQFLLNLGLSPHARDEEGLNALMLAAREGCFDCVPLLLRLKLDPNAKDQRQKSVLAYAARSNRPEITRLLLEAGANPHVKDESGRTPLIEAAAYGQLGQVQELLKHTHEINAADSEGQTALHHGIASRLELVKVLLAAGADLHHADLWGNTPLLKALLSGNPETIELLLKAGAQTDVTNKEGKNVLHLAAQYPQLLAFFLPAPSQQVNQSDQNGQSPLIYAVLHQQLENAERLLQAGAQLKQKNPQNGMNALMYAAQSGSLSLFDALRRHGASLQSLDHHQRNLLMIALQNSGNQAVVAQLTDNPELFMHRDALGNTVLMYAAQNGYFQILQQGLQQGLPPNLQNSQGKTALIFACEAQDLKSAALLLAHGANPKLTDQTGRSARDYVESSHSELRRLLDAYL